MRRSAHDPIAMWRRRRLRELKSEGVSPRDAVAMVNAEEDRRALADLDQGCEAHRGNPSPLCDSCS